MNRLCQLGELLTTGHGDNDPGLVASELRIVAIGGEVVCFIGKGWEIWAKWDRIVLGLVLGWLRLRFNREESFDDSCVLGHTLDVRGKDLGLSLLMREVAFDE